MARRRDPDDALSSARQRYNELARSLADIGFIASGSVTRRLTHCNRAGCRCGGDPPRLHGPYWQWTAKVEGKTVTRRLSEREARLYMEWIANDRRLRAVVEQMRSVAEEARGLILAAEDEARASP